MQHNRAFDPFCNDEYGFTNGGNDHHNGPITQFPYDELDREPDEPESEASKYAEGLIEILSFIIGDHPGAEDSPFGISARALALAFMLRGTDLTGDKLDSLTAIAKHCGVTKQALSHAVLGLRDAAGWLHCRHHKSEESRSTFRASAKEAWKTRIANLKSGAKS